MASLAVLPFAYTLSGHNWRLADILISCGSVIDCFSGINRLWLFLLLLLHQLSSVCYAQSTKPLHFIPLEISTLTGQYHASPFLYYLEDKDQIWSLEDILSPQQQARFTRNQEHVLSFGYVNSTYWLKIVITNSIDPRSAWLLELGGLGRSIDHIEAFVVHEQGTTHFVSGDHIGFNLRPVRHHAVLFPLQISLNERVEVYLRLTTNGSLQLPVTLWSEFHFAEKEHSQSLLDGIFYGILLIMALYNAFLFTAIRDLSYLYYVSYLLSVLGFAISIRGLGFEYLWPESPDWNNKSNLIFAEVTIVFIVLFAQSFLKTRLLHPVFHRLLLLSCVSTIPAIYFILYRSHFHAAIFLSFQYITVIILALSCAFSSYRRGYKAARLYLLAWIGILSMIVVWILNNFQIIRSNIFGAYAIQAGATLQALMFSFALADRFNLMKAERERAYQQKLVETQKVIATTTMFERFVPRQFLRHVSDRGIESIELGKAETEISSVLFSDIRDFTHLSEQMTPQEVLNFLNSYFNRMDKPIHQHDGFIDKFIGDAILAIFEHTDQCNRAINAIEAAIAIQRAVIQYNKDRANCGYAPIRVGIGINTGPVTIGTVGVKERMDTTVLGDTVNLASRLEKLTKTFGVSIIVTAQTLSHIPNHDRFLKRDLGYVKVRGKQQATRIYEIFSADPTPLLAQKQRIISCYQQGMSAFYNRDWNQAQQNFAQCLKDYPNDKASEYFLKRSQQYSKTPPKDDSDLSWQPSEI